MQFKCPPGEQSGLHAISTSRSRMCSEDSFFGWLEKSCWPSKNPFGSPFQTILFTWLLLFEAASGHRVFENLTTRRRLPKPTRPSPSVAVEHYQHALRKGSCDKARVCTTESLQMAASSQRCSLTVFRHTLPASTGLWIFEHLQCLDGSSFWQQSSVKASAKFQISNLLPAAQQASCDKSLIHPATGLRRRLSTACSACGHVNNCKNHCSCSVRKPSPSLYCAACRNFSSRTAC